MSEPSAKIIADSIYADTDEGPGVRLTSMEICFWRPVLAEFNTHGVLSRNSASSRAIPLTKQLTKVQENPAVPLVFPKEQRGMQGGEPLSLLSEINALDEWLRASKAAVESAQALGNIGVHKSVANRLLEPFLMHTVVVTATAWQNFFDQRCSPQAQPEIRAVADLMKTAYDESTPQVLAPDQWHLPYWDPWIDGPLLHQYAVREWPHPDGHADAWWHPSMREAGWNSLQDVVGAVSAARCARVSYETHGGHRDISEDLRLYRGDEDRTGLITAQPPHWSPLEHVATPWPWNRQEGCIHFGSTEEHEYQDFTCMPLDHLPRTGKLLGWRSLRTTVEAEKKVLTFR